MTVSVTALGRALSRWVDFVRRAAVWVTLGSVLLTAALLYYVVTTVGINTDPDSMLAEDLPFRQMEQRFEANFPQQAGLIVAVVRAGSDQQARDGADALASRLAATDLFQDLYLPGGQDFFARNGLLFQDVEALYDLGDRLAQAQPLLLALDRDPSVRGLASVLRLAADNASQEAAALGGLKDALSRMADSVASGRPLAWGALLSGGDGDGRAFVLAQPRRDFGQLQAAGAAMAATRAAAAEIESAQPGVTIRLTGSVPLSHEELATVEAGAGTAGLLSLGLVALLLTMGLKSWRLVVATLATLIMGLIWSAAFATAAIGHLNIISVAFAVLFIGLSIDFGIHFALRFMEEREGQFDLPTALRAAAGDVGEALALSAVAAAIAFYSFVPTDYIGLSELGLISGTSMFVALVANLTVLPALIALLRPPAPPPFGTVGRTGRLAIRGEKAMRRHGGVVVVIAGVVALACLAALPQVRFDFDPINLRDPASESVRTFRALAEDPRSSPYSLDVLVDDPDQIAPLADALNALPEVDAAVTLADFIPANQAERLAAIDELAFLVAPLLDGDAPMAPPDAAGRRAALADLAAAANDLAANAGSGALRDQAARLAVTLETFLADHGDDPAATAALERALVGRLPARLEDLRTAMAAGPVSRADLPADLVARHVGVQGLHRIQVFPAVDTSDPAELERFVAAVRGVTPQVAGAPVSLLGGRDAVVGAFEFAGIATLIGVVILLAAVLRRPRDVLLVLLPLTLAGLLTLAASVVLALPFNFANLIVLPLLLGLGVASGIHLVIRARQEANGHTLAATATPRAVLFSALTTVASFGSLMTSPHPGTASMGALLTLALTFTLICTLGVLPALDELLGRKPRAAGRPGA